MAFEKPLRIRVRASLPDVIEALQDFTPVHSAVSTYDLRVINQIAEGKVPWCAGLTYCLFTLHMDWITSSFSTTTTAWSWWVTFSYHLWVFLSYTLIQRLCVRVCTHLHVYRRTRFRQVSHLTAQHHRNLHRHDSSFSYSIELYPRLQHNDLQLLDLESPFDPFRTEHCLPCVPRTPHLKFGSQNRGEECK